MKRNEDRRKKDRERWLDTNFKSNFEVRNKVIKKLNYFQYFGSQKD